MKNITIINMFLTKNMPQIIKIQKAKNQQVKF